MGFQPFWFDEAIRLEGLNNRPSLNRDLVCDVAIVGGGFTGLWSAIKLKQKAPELKIVIIEKDLCGQGASGRNGGCMLTFSSKFRSLIQHFGVEEAIRLVNASEQAVHAIADFCKKHGIDADVRPHGALYTATNNAQSRGLTQPLALLHKHGINHWSIKAAQELPQLSGSGQHLQGIFSPFGGSVQPGKLVRGLARVAEKMGVLIFEHTKMQSFVPGAQPQLKTAGGNIKAKKVVLAANAWMPSLVPEFSRSVVLVSSDMVITKPQPEKLASKGFLQGTAVADSRVFVHYYRNTPDGRIMLGKGGNYFSYNNRMHPLFNEASRHEVSLQKALKSFFPDIGNTPARSWTGASDRSVTGLPFFGETTPGSNVLYGFGYSGNGVVQSYLGGEFLSSMVLGYDDEWTRSGMAQGIQHYFPPEPFRSVGAQWVKKAIQRKEHYEDRNLNPRWWDKQLAKLAGTAGKADH